MSHFTTIQTQIRDIGALESALQEMGLSLQRNALARGFGNNQRHGEFVIRLRGPYDIALNRGADGAYNIEADKWGKHVV